MTVSNHHWRKFKNAFMQALTLACALLVIAPLGLVFFHLLKSGLGAVNWDFFTQLPKPVGEAGGGMANAIVGTFVSARHRRADRRAGRRARRRLPVRIRLIEAELVDSVRGRHSERRALDHLGHGRLRAGGPAA